MNRSLIAMKSVDGICEVWSTLPVADGLWLLEGLWFMKKGILGGNVLSSILGNGLRDQGINLKY